jgi:hypothetical protein
MSRDWGNGGARRPGPGRPRRPSTPPRRPQGPAPGASGTGSLRGDPQDPAGAIEPIDPAEAARQAARARERDRLRDPESPGRRRRPDRIGDLLPDAARQLGLEEELRFARAITTWDALVAERVPPAVGACRLVRIEPDAIVIAADEPIVAAELRMRAIELLAAFGAAPGGARARFLRLVADPDHGGRPERDRRGPRL